MGSRVEDYLATLSRANYEHENTEVVEEAASVDAAGVEKLAQALDFVAENIQGSMLSTPTAEYRELAVSNGFLSKLEKVARQSTAVSEISRAITGSAFEEKLADLAPRMANDAEEDAADNHFNALVQSINSMQYHEEDSDDVDSAVDFNEEQIADPLVNEEADPVFSSAVDEGLEAEVGDESVEGGAETVHTPQAEQGLGMSALLAKHLKKSGGQ